MIALEIKQKKTSKTNVQEFFRTRARLERFDLLLSSTTHSDIILGLILRLKVTGKVSTFSFFPNNSRLLLDLLDSLEFVPLVDFLSSLDFVSPVVEVNFLLVILDLPAPPSLSTTSSIENIKRSQWQFNHVIFKADRQSRIYQMKIKQRNNLRF